MITRVHTALGVCCLALGVLLPVQSSGAKATQPVFDSAAVEAATTISNGVCSNSTIGISYQLPKGLKVEDAAALNQLSYATDAKIYGTGPEARWFLWGYSQRKSTALLCGARGQSSQVALTVMSARLIGRQGAEVVERMGQELVQQFGAKSLPVRQVSVNGTKLQCADFRATVNSPVRGKIGIWATNCADIVGSYAVMWTLSAASEPQLKGLIASLNSVKTVKAQPRGLPAAAGTTPAATGPIAPDFKTQLDAFMTAWLAERSTSKTMAYFDRAAYSAPPFIGNYCDGWYHYGSSAQQAEQLISENLMGVPKDLPSGTKAATIFTAWKRLPPQWSNESANDLAKDHFLVARLDSASLDHIFSGVFANSQYGNYLRRLVSQGAAAYWVVFPEVMPDGDIFVIFTVWQKTGRGWKITDTDIVCQ